LHHTSMVSRESKAVFRNLHMYFAREADGLEKLIERPGRACDGAKNRWRRDIARRGLHGGWCARHKGDRIKFNATE